MWQQDQAPWGRGSPPAGEGPLSRDSTHLRPGLPREPRPHLRSPRPQGHTHRHHSGPQVTGSGLVTDGSAPGCRASCAFSPQRGEECPHSCRGRRGPPSLPPFHEGQKHRTQLPLSRPAGPSGPLRRSVRGQLTASSPRGAGCLCPRPLSPVGTQQRGDRLRGCPAHVLLGTLLQRGCGRTPPGVLAPVTSGRHSPRVGLPSTPTPCRSQPLLFPGALPKTPAPHTGHLLGEEALPVTRLRKLLPTVAAESCLGGLSPGRVCRQGGSGPREGLSPGRVWPQAGFEAGGPLLLGKG